MTLTRIIPVGVCLLAIVGLAMGQNFAPPGAPATAPAMLPPAKPTSDGWRTPNPNAMRSDAATPATDPRYPVQPAAAIAHAPVAKVTPGPGSLPNDAGQEWRDYDISPYTTRVTTTNRPEQAIVDWVLRETGYEVWHGEPLGLLSANKRTLRVYHTPQVHAVVAEVVDRFVSSEAESEAFNLHVISVGSPDWRTKAHRLLHPVTTQSPGVQAWLVAKEDAALLLADLHKRSDFHEHSSPRQSVNNGQLTIVSSSQAHNYVRDVTLRSTAWPGFEPQMAQIDEGFSLEFSPLLSLDRRTIDAVVKCHVDQVEKMIPVYVDAPTPTAPKQRTKIEVPQLTSVRLHERFHWPIDQVLVISLGVVASPVKAASTINLNVPLLNTPPRSDLLVVIDAKGRSATLPTAPPATATPPGAAPTAMAPPATLTPR